MSDNPPEPITPAEASTPNTVTHVSGGVNLDAQRDVNIGGDVVGRDKIIQNIQNIDQRARTAAEEAEQARSFEAQRLAQGVSAFAQRLQARAGESTDAGKGGPYKGLLEYRLSDAELFFGRDRAIRELLEHLQRGPLTVLHAESGAGKTSLLQAGISPHLIAAGHLPIYLRPYNVTPSLALKRAFLPNLSDTPNLAQAPLRDFLSRVGEVFGTATTSYVFLDQFEEFFTQLKDSARPEFGRELAECLDDESLNVRWVLALRSEFFGNLASFRPRVRNPFENDYRLNRLTRNEASEAVALPAARRGISFEDGLIDTILNDLGKDEVEPPQVQLVCSTLYETLPPSTEIITREMYTSQGGAAGILREHLGRVLKRDLPTGQRPIAQRLLEELITSDIHRVMRTHDELVHTLAGQGVQVETLDAVLGQLVDSRLLRVEETEGEAAYELAHDYLLSEIKLDPAVQARKAAQELLNQEVHAYQLYSTLLSDDKLAIIEARRNELTLSADAKTLIQKSERALKRRQRFVFGGIGLVMVLIIVAVLAGLGAVGAQNLADQAQKQRATSEAGAVRAARDAEEARATETVVQARVARLIEQSHISPLDAPPSALILGLDGHRLQLWAASQISHTLQAIDPLTGLSSQLILVNPHPSALLFDGHWLWVASQVSNTVQAVDPHSGSVVASFEVGHQPAALASESDRIWIANQADGTVQAIYPLTRNVATPITIEHGIDTFPSALAVVNGRLWIGTYYGAYILDPSNNSITHGDSRHGEFTSTLAFDGARVWVARTTDYGSKIRSFAPEQPSGSAQFETDSGHISALAPDVVVTATIWIVDAQNRTVRALDAMTGLASEPLLVGNDPVALVTDGNALWVASQADRTVEKITLGTGILFSPFPVGRQPSGLGFAPDGNIWFTNIGDGTAQQIVPGAKQTVSYPVSATLRPRRVDTSQDCMSPFGYRPRDHDSLAVCAGDRMWATGSIGDDRFFTDVLAEVDRLSQETIWQIPFSGASALAYDGQYLWVSKITDNTVRAIDPNTGREVAHFAVGGTPSSLLFDGTRLWITNSGSNTVQYILVYKRAKK